MRAILLASAIAVAGAASASFDLILIADAGLGVVHRYDGDSGVYLGNFGGGAFLNCQSITVDKATQRAYVGGANNGSGIGIYNYNTGEFIGYNSNMNGFMQDLALTAGGAILGTLAGGSNVAVRRLNSVPFGNSTTSFAVTTSAGSLSAVGEDSAGKILAINRVAGTLWRWNTTTTTAPEAELTNANLVGAGGGAVSGQEMISILQNGRMVRMNTTGAMSLSLGSLPSSVLTSGVDAAFGHQNSAWGLAMNGTSTRLQMYVRSSGGTGSAFDAFGPSRTLSQVQDPVGMAVVLAPEPGTMLALSAGAAALLRRRRKRG